MPNFKLVHVNQSLKEASIRSWRRRVGADFATAVAPNGVGKLRPTPELLPMMRADLSRSGIELVAHRLSSGGKDGGCWPECLHAERD